MGLELTSGPNAAGPPAAPQMLPGWPGTIEGEALAARLDRSRLEGLLQAFPIGRVAAVGRVGGGTVKLLYRIRTREQPGDNLALHVLPPHVIGRFARTDADFRYERAFVEALAAGGVPVPRHYPTRDGAAFVQTDVDGVRCFVALYDFVPGRSPRRLNDAQRCALAQTLGRMHRLGRGLTLRPPRMQGFNVGDLIAGYEGRLPLIHQQTPSEARALLAPMRLIWSEAWERIAASYRNASRFPVHGDYWAGNLVFQGETLAAVVDFDECHDDGAWVELAMTLESVCRPVAPARLTAVADLLLAAYGHEASLTRTEEELTSWFWLYRQASGGFNRLVRRLDSGEADLGLAEARRRLRKLAAIQRVAARLT